MLAFQQALCRPSTRDFGDGARMDSSERRARCTSDAGDRPWEQSFTGYKCGLTPSSVNRYPAYQLRNSRSSFAELRADASLASERGWVGSYEASAAAALPGARDDREVTV